MKMKAPEGTTHVFHDKETYTTDKDGCVDVPASAANVLVGHGFTQVVEEEKEEKKSKK